MKRIIPTAERGLKALSHTACILGGWFVILLSVGICIEVFLRKVFNESLQGVDEYGGYALAITASLGFAYCFYEHAHIRIDLLTRRLPRTLGRALSIFAIVMLGVVAGLLGLQSIRLAQESQLFMAFSNTPLRTPIVYPQAIWAAGFCLFFVAIVLRLLHIFQSLLSGDGDRLGDLLGESTSDDGVEGSTRQGVE
ncbi:TRAP transporter small permease subunit [Allosediminivita pacifica]|uniref:TRAP transporter small permease protein n=1 Tax=Allosediminivita pacifica TaxID=1267769 RepID=A0A2T6AR13_9RHOB|nr:TRAP transporter small permease [Allosediminivita pacifica]PTX46252.1 TRAP-type C4-dicarboxylate transport system permease small subunit [Allosediminivita pacifica]GGB17626.1 TRAP transporter small permease protein [Allosediminivita pacifica]